MQCRGQRVQRVIEILIILADAGCEVLKVRKQRGREDPHSRSEEADPPADRNCMNWLGKSPRPLAAAARTGESDSRVNIDCTPRRRRRPNQRRFSALTVPGSRPSDGLVHDLAGYLRQLAMLLLAQRTQPFEGLMLGAAAPAHHDSDSPVNDAANFQGRLQLIGQPSGLCKDMGVVYSDRGRRGEDLAEFGGPVVEDVLVVGVDIHRATTPSGVINGNDTTLCTPSRATRARRSAATANLRRASLT